MIFLKVFGCSIHDVSFNIKMDNEKSKERSILIVLTVTSRCEIFVSIKCEILQALRKGIYSFSEGYVNMQGMIDEGSDHINDLEQKITTQGKDHNYFETFLSFLNND